MISPRRQCGGQSGMGSRARPVRCVVGVFAIAGARPIHRPPGRDRAHRPPGHRSRGQSLVRRGARCGLARSDRPARGQAHRPIRASRGAPGRRLFAGATACRRRQRRQRPRRRLRESRRLPSQASRISTTPTTSASTRVRTACSSATVAPWRSSIRKRWRSREGSNCRGIRRRSSSSPRDAGSSSTCRALGRLSWSTGKAARSPRPGR